EFTTPTGARHHSKAPPLPGPVGGYRSAIEIDFGYLITKHAA
ncbi:HNH endonuclease, partial [Mycolicibacterium sp. P9-64]